MMLHRRLLPIVRGFNRNSIIRASSARDSGYQTYSSSSSSSSRAPPSSSSSPPPNYDKDGEDEPRNRVDISADDNQVLRQFDNRSFNTVIKIDKSALNQKTYRHASEQSPPGKEPETPLVSELKARIKVRPSLSLITLHIFNTCRQHWTDTHTHTHTPSHTHSLPLFLSCVTPGRRSHLCFHVHD